MANNTRELRGRPVTAEEAAKSVQRLINSHFQNRGGEGRARCTIPVDAMDDDVVASDYVFEASQRIAELEAQLAEADFDFGGWRSIKARLESQLAALSWREITPECLPQVGDEVASWKSDLTGNKPEIMAVPLDTSHEQWIWAGYTHFRTINAPQRRARRTMSRSNFANNCKKQIKSVAELSDKAYRMQSIDRAVAILHILADKEYPMTLSEVTLASGLNRNTTYRFLIALLRHGMVLRTVKARYLIADQLVTLFASMRKPGDDKVQSISKKP